ncbi:hypothetical protein BHE74_00033583 [Ensete ventricosum]|nr:hypothetical protein BHE74_00033583 [Ensete ventricosum]RZS10906.1 hypothetical protein BHM03_00042175 [Ensete ventricosum]
MVDSSRGEDAARDHRCISSTSRSAAPLFFCFHSAIPRLAISRSSTSSTPDRLTRELEPRTKALAYKIKATSRESPAQKAANVFDPDLRTHWSTGTNTKEWILLELDVLLSSFPFLLA